jgi:hypothetical protein
VIRFCQTPTGDIEDKYGPKVALEIEIGYNEKRNQINFTPGIETGFFKKTSRLLELTR